MTFPVEKFRTQYPEGCLSADLVSVNDGQYIVRAVVSNGGVPLATGLAASVDVQIAEDKARERAIALLGIETTAIKTTGSETTAAQIEPKPDSSSKVATAKAPQLNGQQTINQNPAPAANPPSTPEPVAIDESEEVAITLEPPEAELDPSDDSGPPLDSIAGEPARTSAATIALENFSTSLNPVDLSDVIAQTDVELTRLGWTSVQGREYLEKTYGKRSRQQLTDEELMSFLLYLEDQQS